jgi:phenylalanyl-tRNA synthetase alpha chain
MGTDAMTTDTTAPTAPAGPAGIDLGALEAEAARIRAEAERQLAAVTDLSALDAVRNELLSKKGLVSGLVKMIGTLDAAARPHAGKVINTLRDGVEALYTARRDTLSAAALDASLKAAAVDISMPGRRTLPGRPHPIRQTQAELVSIFSRLGYTFREYRDVETEFHNFDSLQQPDWHPARDMHDTYYVSPAAGAAYPLDQGQYKFNLLRTHTTAFELQAMAARGGQGTNPLREVTTGRCYRRDAVDARHSAVFHQFEGLAITEDASFAELKWVLLQASKQLFGPRTQIRLRPSYFPFTTPSAEVDCTCPSCHGKGCRTCSQTGWLEILGCGMTRPEIVELGGYDSTKFRGFAFGMGVERIAMLVWDLDDIRMLYENDVAFLSQF